MKELLDKLLQNTFIPKIDMHTKLPDAAGAYLICSKKQLQPLHSFSSVTGACHKMLSYGK